MEEPNRSTSATRLALALAIVGVLGLWGLLKLSATANQRSATPPVDGRSQEPARSGGREGVATLADVDRSTHDAGTPEEMADEGRRSSSVSREAGGEPALIVEIADSAGLPAAHALVELELPEGGPGAAGTTESAKAGVDGRAQFAAWPSASFRILVTPAEPTDSEEPPLLEAGRAIEPSEVDRSAPLRIQLARASRITGTLDCSDGSSPRSSGLDVFHLGTGSWTNAAAVEDGSFTSQWMPPGEVIVYARNGTWTETDLRLHRRISLAEGRSHTFHGTLEPALTLEGTTVTAVGSPAPGQTVTVVEAANPGNSRSATSNEDGRFRVEGLHATDYVLALMGEDGAEQRITLQRGPTATQAAPIVIPAHR